jgi:membrane protease YdiL (CAAX protease family)
MEPDLSAKPLAPPPALDGTPEGVPSEGHPLEGASNAQRRALAITEVFLCSSVPTQLLIQALMLAFGWRPTTSDDQFSLSFVVTMSLVDTVLLIGLMVVLTRAHGESVKELWLGRRPLLRESLLGLALVPWIFMIVVALLLTLRMLAPALHNVETNPMEQLASGGAMNAAAFGVVAIFAGGVREELQRAFLLRRFELHLGGARVGVLVLSVAFGLGHALQGWDAAITTGALGAVWAVIYLRRRSSVAPLVSHAGFNSLEVLRIAIVG